VISNVNAGNLTIDSPAGSITLTGQNTYTGNTTITSSSGVTIGGSGALGWNGTDANYAANIANSGSLTFASTRDLQTISGAISGSGSITVNTATSNQIHGGGSGSFLTASTPTTIATGSTVHDVLTTITSARLAGAGVSGTPSGAVLFRSYDRAANTGTFQVQVNDGSGARAVLVQLAQSGADVVATALQAATSSASSLGRDMANWTSAPVATDGSTAGAIGIDQLFTADRVSFTGNNTYTGSTTITKGVLEIGGSGSLGYVNGGTNSHSGTISNSDLLAFTTSADNTLAAALSGAGSLFKSDASTLTLTSGSNTITGPIAVSKGELKIGGSGRLHSSTYTAGFALSDSAQFNYSSSVNQTLSGDLIGLGRLIKAGGSTLTLSGYKRWAADTISQGDTVVDGGTLA
jgi:autotransporter-associated beta strand protein